MSDPHRIETVEQLRERMGDASPTTAAKVESKLDDIARDFIARSPFLILGTADADGRQDASPKGDHEGFVSVADDTTLLIPDRKGNKLLMGLENILENPKIGLIFMVGVFRRNGGHLNRGRSGSRRAVIDRAGRHPILHHPSSLTL